METPKQHKVREIHVKDDKKVRTVEKYFKQLDFAHRLRLAVETLTDKCLESGSDARIEAKGRKADFVITIKRVDN